MRFQAIIPQQNLNWNNVNSKLVDGMDRYTKLVLKEFQETTQTWDNKPSFDRLVTTNGFKVVGEVSTSNKIYRYVSNGTRRHFVAPRRANALRFRSQYTAKSAPGRIPSRSGGASGNFVFSRGHYVNGIEARKFDTQIKKDTEQRFKDYMLNAFENALLGV